ncbi:hypothetical protein RND81_13G124300 [Saponaria officinalis]|uniref:Uncharacterized protein n=1 Tax=Saponaria officinalis TaxID=3572 RepID=A0AAW1GZ39_SAPOF
MVAISLYRGNLHRVPQETPRTWLMPTSRISLKDFRRLIHRRTSSLSLLPSTSSPSLSNPTPPPESEFAGELAAVVENPNLSSERCVEDSVAVAAVESRGEDGGVDVEKGKEAAVDVDDRVLALQVNGNLDAVDEKEKRKNEIEEKLQILNEKKHNLVQALKQILNAEEELKRRSNVQANRPPLPLHVDASNDSGSMTRHATPRTGSEVNVTADMEAGDDAVNHNLQPRQLLRVNSTSPSAESALRRPPFFQHNAASYPSRAAMVAAGSPSRFAPSGNQGQSSNMPTVSVSGTNYIASSPSPAASGGTSCFRDTRHPSPWS